MKMKLRATALAGACRITVMGMALAAGPWTASAAAQTAVNAVTPYAAVVEADDAVLRAQPQDLMYPVLRLPRGQVLRVDGEALDSKGRAWWRVTYPAGTFVFVAAEAVQLEPGGKSGTVTKVTQPKAPNLSTGYKGSWSPALSQGLQPGAKVTILEVEPAPGGQGAAAYRIVPPESARGFVPASMMRKATPQEAAALAAQPPATPSATPGTGRTPAGSSQEQPAGVATAPAGPAATPDGGDAEPTMIVQRPVVRKPSPYERLEASFQEIRKEPSDTAEYGELMSQYAEELNKLEDNPANRSTRARLTQRIEYLKIASDLQAQRRLLAEQEQSLSAADQRLREKMAEVDRVRQYTIVGRLSASTLYDGKNLPLMYRVQSVGGPAPRTLAYVKPDEKLNIDGKLGAVVGVLGEAQLDPTLKLNIITPLRVDTLEAAEKGNTPAPASGPSGEGQRPT
jgi:hypothetical protein